MKSKRIILAGLTVFLVWFAAHSVNSQIIELPGEIVITPPPVVEVKKDGGSVPLPVTTSPATTSPAATPAEKTAAAPTSGDGKKKTYTVVSGDYLMKIARELLGDPERFWEIVELNKDKYPSIVKNPHLIYPGWEFDLPVDAQSSSGEGESVSAAELAGAITGTVSVNGTLNIRAKPWGRVEGTFRDGDQIKILKKKDPGTKSR